MEPRNSNCQHCAETAAYLDGELDARALLQFEDHLSQCNFCAQELSEQRRLLCALDFALGSADPGVDLPGDFAQIVATNAESDMSGVRKRVEHRRALRFCFILAVAAFSLLGGATLFSSVSIPISAFARTSMAIIGFAWNAIYNAGVGAAVILRPLGRRLVFESHPVSLIAILLFAISIALLPRLIVSYHRKQITE